MSGVTGKGSRRRGARAARMPAVLLLAAFLVQAVLACGCGGGSSTAVLIEKGEQAFSRGDYREAVDYYGRALNRDPDSSTYNLRGMAYRFWANQTGSAEHRAEEIESFRAAVALDSSNAIALVNLGASLFYNGRKQEAATYLEKALAVNPAHPDRANIEELIRQAESGPGSEL